MLGLYVSDHPLLGVEHVLAARRTCRIAALPTDAARRRTVTIGGILSGVHRRMTKQGKPWASAQLEDLGRRDRGAVLPGDLRRGRRTSPRTRSWWSRAGWTSARTIPS